MALEIGESLTLAGLIRGRRSIRSYADRPVPEEVLEAILEAARWAPSPHHALPFRLALAIGEARIRLAREMGERWRQDLARDGVPQATIDSELAKSRRRLEGAPAILIGCVYLEPLDEYPDESRQWAEHTMASHSLGAALQNAMLTAHAHGLGSAWMCAPLFCSDVVREALDLPQSWVPHALVTLGYPARVSPEGARPPLDRLVIRRS